MPAHVTVLYPFLPPARIDSAVLASLTAAISTVPHFSVTFARVEWFGRSVLWLAPVCGSSGTPRPTIAELGLGV